MSSSCIITNVITIRLAEQQDVAILAEIYKEAYNVLNIGEHWDNNTSLRLLEYLYEEQSDLFFVAEKDGVIIGGSVALVKPWWDGNHLVDGEIFVHPNHQGKRVGVKLIKHMFKEGKGKYDAISWDTFTHKIYEHPLSWYKKLGFEEIKHFTMISGNIEKVLKNIDNLH